MLQLLACQVKIRVSFSTENALNKIKRFNLFEILMSVKSYVRDNLSTFFP